MAKTLKQIIENLSESEHQVGDVVNYSHKISGFGKSAVGGQGTITKKTSTHYVINDKRKIPHSAVKSKVK